MYADRAGSLNLSIIFNCIFKYLLEAITPSVRGAIMHDTA